MTCVAQSTHASHYTHDQFSVKIMLGITEKDSGWREYR